MGKQSNLGREFRMALVDMDCGPFPFLENMRIYKVKDVREAMIRILRNPKLKEINLCVGFFRDEDGYKVLDDERVSEALVHAILAGPLRKVSLDGGPFCHQFLHKLCNARTPRTGIPLNELEILGDIHDEELLHTVINKCPSLKKFKYTFGAMDLSVIKAIAASNIDHLTFEFFSFKYSNVGPLSLLITQRRNFKEVNASLNTTENRNLVALFEATKVSPVIKKLDLRFHEFSYEEVDSLASLLVEQHCPITYLKLYSNGFGDCSWADLVEAFGKNTSLTELNVGCNMNGVFTCGLSSEETVFLLASLRNRKIQLKRLTLVLAKWSSEPVRGLCNFLEVGEGLEYLNVVFSRKSFLDFGRKSRTAPEIPCTSEDMARYWNALQRNKSLKHVTVLFNEQDDKYSAQEALEAFLASENLHTLELNMETLTCGAARSILHVVANNQTKSLRKLMLHADGAEKGAIRLVITAIAANTNLRDFYVESKLFSGEDSEMLRVAGLLNAVWRDEHRVDGAKQNRYLFYLLGSNEDTIVMRASIMFWDEGNRGSSHHRAKIGVARSEGGDGPLRLLIISQDLEVLLDIALTPAVKLSRSAENRAFVRLRYRSEDRRRIAFCLDFSSAGLAKRLLSIMGGGSDLEERDRQRLLTFGEENADRFMTLAGDMMATQKMAALIAGVMDNDRLIYALSEHAVSHLKAALMEDQ